MTYLITIALILGIGLIGIGVDRLYRGFARKNPQLGPFRNSDKGCGSCTAGSGCSGKSCSS
ncbi:MAG: hypothetical protein Q8M09_10170 [Pseudomonadota bacterium]|nr:hypothetical protein [Pseudomonadota bacterium]MDP1904593.1 hypothetical protein [Pseudomonadota bacterium]MDP2353208.1 hypothetical protein [Pseudomonadota bacterium]